MRYFVKNFFIFIIKYILKMNIKRNYSVKLDLSINDLFKNLNVEAIVDTVNYWVDLEMYNSIGLWVKSLYDFNFIINKVFSKIVPSKVYVENVNWSKIKDLWVNFIEKRKYDIFKWFNTRTELIYFENNKKDILFLNCVWNNINSAWKVIEYLNLLFKDVMNTEKINWILENDFMFDNINNLHPKLILNIRNKLKQFKTILIVDEKTYKDIYKYPLLLNGTNILFIVCKILSENKYCISDMMWDNLTYYNKYIDLSILFSDPVIYTFIKKELFSILWYDKEELENDKLEKIVTHLKNKWSYYIIMICLEQLKYRFSLYKFEDDNINYKLETIIDLLGINDDFSKNNQFLNI